jgi:hypothetical protein
METLHFISNGEDPYPIGHYKKIGLWQQNLFVAQKSQFRRLMY